MIKSEKFNKLLSHSKNFGLYFSSSLIAALVGVLLNPLYAANLSHEDYAIIGYYSSFNLILIPLLSFSLLSFYARQYYFTEEEKRESLGSTVVPYI